MDAAEKLTLETRPDVFIAEPVGSCTDLVATVSYPLRRIYGDNFTIAPLSVVLDPVRAMRIFDLEPGKRFSDKVIYIYQKQLEEADFIVINKCDLIANEKLSSLEQILQHHYPRAAIYVCSARNILGLSSWFEASTTSRLADPETMEIDYGIYGEGEALLGWLNATVDLNSNELWNGNKTLLTLAEHIQQRLAEDDSEIAHLKMTLSPTENLYGDLAVVNVVRNDHNAELSQTLPDELNSGQLIINLRAEAEPEELHRAVRDVLQGWIGGSRRQK